MVDNENKQFAARAFLSCSLREEDKPFIEFVERILIAHNIEAFGTVGKFSATPENPAVAMRRNIPECDFVVICATPRYIQKDLQTGKTQYGLSEMIHIETGIAYAYDKPVVVFVKEGTNVGNFIPNITQYITLDGCVEDFQSKRQLVFGLLSSAYTTAKSIRSKMENNEVLKSTGKVVVTGLAIYGGLKLLEKFFED